VCQGLLLDIIYIFSNFKRLYFVLIAVSLAFDFLRSRDKSVRHQTMSLVQVVKKFSAFYATRRFLLNPSHQHKLPRDGELTFRRNVLPLSPGQNVEAENSLETLVNFDKTLRRQQSSTPNKN
jgi:hypothetical protein